jgi:nucleotide-binding universal stress UspA family protein
MPIIQRIVYATDFSDASREALEYAVYLAGKLSAELHCVHVVDDSYQYWMNLDSGAVPVGPSVEDLMRSAESHCKEFLAGAVGADVAIITKILRGNPFLEIVRYAKTAEAGLLVLGTHGRGALKHILMGSVAEKVVRKSPCPVLTIRHKGHKFEMP